MFENHTKQTVCHRAKKHLIGAHRPIGPSAGRYALRPLRIDSKSLKTETGTMPHKYRRERLTSRQGLAGAYQGDGPCRGPGSGAGGRCALIGGIGGPGILRAGVAPLRAASRPAGQPSRAARRGRDGAVTGLTSGGGLRRHIGPGRGPMPMPDGRCHRPAGRGPMGRAGRGGGGWPGRGCPGGRECPGTSMPGQRAGIIAARL